MAQQFATHLDRSRFEATFCVSRWNRTPNSEHDAALSELREAGVTFLPLDRSSRFQLNPWRKLITYLREWDADILHSHMFGSNVWGALIAPRAKVPVFVAHEHTWSFEGQPLRKFLDRNLIARRADAFVAVSRLDQRRMVEIERIPESKTRFIPNGIPPSLPLNPQHDAREKLGIAPDQPVIGMVAILRAQKAVDVLIRAAALIRDAVPNVKVLLVGGGETAGGPDEGNPYIQGLRALSAELGLESTIEFLGLRTDIPDLLASFDVAVLSSDYEGSPLSVLEYMEAGKPVVATRVGGVPDLVEDRVTGLLVEPQDPEAFAAAVIELLRDPDRAEAMGRAGQALRMRDFTIDATLRRVESLYEELYAAKAEHRPS